MSLPQWNFQAFGCIARDMAQFTSLLRTQLSASLPAPFLSKFADSSAPVELDYSLEMSDDGFRAWQQWTTYDLNDGSLPFQMFLPWGDTQVAAHCRLTGAWQAQRESSQRWSVTGLLQITRESLPKFSGGAR